MLHLSYNLRLEFVPPFLGGCTKEKNAYGEPDLPCPRHFRMPPDHGERKRPHGEKRHYDNGFSEIPWKLFFCGARRSETVQKLAAVLALYRGVLYIFSA